MNKKVIVLIKYGSHSSVDLKSLCITEISNFITIKMFNLIQQNY